ncbi:NUDIX hydrolase [Methylobacterium sp. 4-46]|uniref:NUDIX hydrolase n=1 Tax=unclassified Methylobacterium TaxID=2615210 RepID=UPI000165C7DE|nr:MULTISPECIES: NUDIX hydrolase [Methylobacterium]ACA16560.1 NUDIX hydrolase [Methylobacterium sp. 4-46]WFT82269.1 NUDIX hydrolase [Methylobacterium nodulans]
MTASDPQGRRYPARPYLAASVAVVRGGRVLVASRGGSPLHGLYSLPGGLVEPGERLAETALRELREEVGVEAEIVAGLSPTEVIERDGDGRVLHHFVIMAHAARWLRHEPAPGDEALDVRWVTVAEAAALPTTDGLLAILAEAVAAVEGPP